MKSMRESFGEALLEIGATNENVIVLDADLSRSTGTWRFAESCPSRFINVGISEQDLMGTAAGLALSGKIPIVSTYAIFGTGRAWEQIRNTVCLANLNVKIVLTHAGVTNFGDGATHQSFEDIALMRVIPNMKVVVPCDAIEAKKAIMAAVTCEGPVYIRLGRDPTPIIHEEDYRFTIGKSVILRDGSDATIAASGIMVWEALRASEILKRDGISVQVVDVPTIKPLDILTILHSAKKTGAMVTLEDHNIHGGLGSAVAEVIVRNYPIPMEFVGIEDRFGESGSLLALKFMLGLSIPRIVKAVKKVLSRK
ncbi:MAG: transketolase family protein [Candidatus Bathyarchaeia archaeon]